MTRSLCVHLGLPKTATTTLQRGLFDRHSEIEFLGKCSGRDAQPALRRCANEAAYRLGNQLFWDHVHSIDVAEARRIWDEELQPSIDAQKLAVFSFEGLAVADLAIREAVARNLRDVFGRCRVIIGIRRPMDLVEALYFQRLRRRHLGKQDDDVERSSSPSTEQWLDSIVAGHELAPHLDYARTVRIFVEALGRANVGVFVLERLVKEPTRFAQDLCGFMEVDSEEGARLLEGRRHNTRLRQAVADRMLRLERPGIISSIYARTGRSFRKRILRLKRVDNSPAASLSVPSDMKKAIEERTREGNRWIAEAFDLRLEEYGYPV